MLASAPSPKPPAPRLSVIIPLGDARIDEIDQVRSWTARQTLARDQFQIIAVGDGSNEGLEAAIAQDMAPHDKLARCAIGDHVMVQNLIGAHAADGDILLFGEHHVIAAPECVATVLRHFDGDPDTVAAQLKSIHRDGAAHGFLDGQWFAALHAKSHAPGGWERLHTGEFAIRRDTYFKLGGHQGRYGLFADALLSANAREAGIAVPLLDQAVVTHISATMRDHQHHVEDYTAGECAARADHGDEWAERNFGHAAIWANRAGLNAATERAALAALLRVIAHEMRHPTSRIARLAREAARRIAPAAFGMPGRHAVAWTRTRWSELRATHLGRNRAARWAHFQRAWRGMIAQTRLREAQRHAPAGVIAPTPRSWPMAEIPVAQRIGFHGAEESGDGAFRWSEPVAMLRLALPAGRHRVTIATHPTRGAGEPALRGIFWRGRRIVPGAIDAESAAFTIEAADTPDWLILVIDPWHVPGDDRRLGLPIRGLAHEPAA